MQPYSVTFGAVTSSLTAAALLPSAVQRERLGCAAAWNCLLSGVSRRAKEALRD